MLEGIDLDSVAMGETGAKEAHEVIAPMISSGDADVIRKAFIALRAWTWKALNERRRDDELRAWYNLLRGYSAFLGDRDPEHSVRISVLYELVYESISVAEVIPVDELLKRHHPMEILKSLSIADRQRLNRADLAEAAGINETVLARTVSLLAANGLVNRDGHGSGLTYAITLEGLARLRLHGEG